MTPWSTARETISKHLCCTKRNQKQAVPLCSLSPINAAGKWCAMERSAVSIVLRAPVSLSQPFIVNGLIRATLMVQKSSAIARGRVANGCQRQKSFSMIQSHLSQRIQLYTCPAYSAQAFIAKQSVVNIICLPATLHRTQVKHKLSQQ